MMSGVEVVGSGGGGMVYRSGCHYKHRVFFMIVTRTWIRMLSVKSTHYCYWVGNINGPPPAWYPTSRTCTYPRKLLDVGGYQSARLYCPPCLSCYEPVTSPWV